jgi:hypothetical protein
VSMIRWWTSSIGRCRERESKHEVRHHQNGYTLFFIIYYSAKHIIHPSSRNQLLGDTSKRARATHDNYYCWSRIYLQFIKHKL